MSGDRVILQGCPAVPLPTHKESTGSYRCEEPVPSSQSIDSELGGVGKGLLPGPTGEGGGRGQGQLLRDSAMDSDFGTVKFSPCACCITPLPLLFLAGGRRKIRRELAQPPGPGVTCWPKPGEASGGSRPSPSKRDPKIAPWPHAVAATFLPGLGLETETFWG